MLPKFQYHPDPIGSGAFKQEGTRTCYCCGKETGIWYDGPFLLSDDPDNEDFELPDDCVLCPQCIADGSAAEKSHIYFNDDPRYRILGDRVTDPEKLAEWKYRTPNFYTWNTDFWFTHCGDFCAYISNVGWDEIVQMGIEQQVQETYQEERFGAFDDLQHCMGKNCSIEGHLFRCLHCGKYFLSVDYD